MKKNSLISLLMPILFSANIFQTGAQNITAKVSARPPEGTAVLITGAAARIPQEAALLESLYNNGMLHHVVFIAGVSSGALNTVMLNAILTKKITWNEYRNILFNINDSDIYRSKDKKLPVDTAPLKSLLTSILHDKLGYFRIGDLPVPSAISITDIDILKLIRRNYRLSNLKINPESDPSLDLVEILMASTAFPIVFPGVRIDNAPTLPDHDFIDGGLVDDHVPYTSLLQFIKYRGQSVDTVIIVSRKSVLHPDLSEELLTLGINDKGLMDKLGISPEDFLMSAFIKGLRSLQKEAPDLAKRTLVYIPDFEQNFLMLNFNDLEEQYRTTSEWAARNKPVSLEQFLNSEEKK